MNSVPLPKKIPFEPKRIHIAHLVHSFDIGGIENGIVNLVNNMNQAIFYNYIISFTFIGDFHKRITSKNTRIISINKKPGNSLAPYFQLRKDFKKNRIDIVHARGWATMMEGIVSARLAQVPVVIYGFPGKTYEDTLGEKKSRIFAQRILLKTVDGVVTYINDMKNDICETLHVPEEKVELIKNGVNLRKFKRGNRNLKTELGIRKGDFVIGAVGRLDPVKNYGVMIDAYHLLSNNYDNLKMILVGDGVEFNTLSNKVIDMGLSKTITLLGKSDDITNLLNCFDVFIQPSFYEGLSNTILEAMAVGLPIIASRVGGNGDIIIEEENGLLFEPTDIEGLAKAIEKIYMNNELREKMGDTNKKKIQNEFSLERMVKQYEKYYQKIFLKKTS